MRIFGPVNSGLGAGGAGVSVADADSTHALVGEIVGVYIKYSGSPDVPCPSSTIVVISTSGFAMPSQTLLTVTAANTDGWFRPTQQGCDDTGTPIAGAYLPTLIGDNINVAISAADVDSYVEAWFILKGEDE